MPPFNLPDHAVVVADALRAIAERYGVDPADVERLPETGIFNAIYRLGEHLILRVPRDHPAFIAAIHTEAVAVPAARPAGVRTPRLVATDVSRALLPVPFAIYERVRGETLELLDREPEDTADAWRELGRDLARTHLGVAADGPAGSLSAKGSLLDDPRSVLDQRAMEGWFTAHEGRWLGRWLDRLAPAMAEPVPSRFLHGDVQGTNVMVAGDAPEYRAVIDWGSASWGDVALDFGAVPLRAVRLVLEGHRSIAPLDGDAWAEARIVWRHLQLALRCLPRGAVPGRSWAERPLAIMLDVLRFFAESPGDRWLGAAPPTMGG